MQVTAVGTRRRDEGRPRTNWPRVRRIAHSPATIVFLRGAQARERTRQPEQSQTQRLLLSTLLILWPKWAENFLYHRKVIVVIATAVGSLMLGVVTYFLKGCRRTKGSDRAREGGQVGPRFDWNASAHCSRLEGGRDEDCSASFAAPVPAWPRPPGIKQQMPRVLVREGSRVLVREQGARMSG